mgnify:CR=1 FL=1
MSALRRGFKSWAEQVSLGFRRDLNQGVISALDPRVVAEHLGIVVWTPEEVAKLGRLDNAHLEQLLIHDSKSWSAVTLLYEKNHIIIVNSSHKLVRKNSNIMHELAHTILEHKPARIDMTPEGLMILDSYDKTQEDEADWLSGSLLVPRDPLLSLLTIDPSSSNAASFFNVSNDMINWRRQTTGVDIQLKRRRNSQ